MQFIESTFGLFTKECKCGQFLHCLSKELDIFYNYRCLSYPSISKQVDFHYRVHSVDTTIEDKKTYIMKFIHSLSLSISSPLSSSLTLPCLHLSLSLSSSLTLPLYLSLSPSPPPSLPSPLLLCVCLYACVYVHRPFLGNTITSVLS